MKKMKHPIKGNLLIENKDTNTIISFIPASLAKRWKPIKTITTAIAAFADSKTNMTVVSSLETKEEGETYIHLEVFHNFRRPDWNEVMTAKNAFIGKDKSAFIILDDNKKNAFDDYSIHVWSRVENGNS